MDVYIKFLTDVGVPIGFAILMGSFILIVLMQMLNNVVETTKVLTSFAVGLENRARTMSNEILKIDILVSTALGLRPDIDRISRAENFIEDGKIDVRRD